MDIMQSSLTTSSVDEPRMMPEGFVTGALIGHLTRVQLQGVLEQMSMGLSTDQRRPVLLDCSCMDGYDLDARHAFVEWNKQWREHISRVGIVTDNRVYHLVISAMSLASGQSMKGFAELSEAEAWLRSSD